MKIFALITVLLAAASTQAFADETDTSNMLDSLEQFAEKVDALDRGEVAVYELADSSSAR